MVSWVNICLEQTIGTCLGGCIDAMCIWLPHLSSTVVDPCAAGFTNCCTAMMGK